MQYQDKNKLAKLILTPKQILSNALKDTKIDKNTLK